MQDRRLFLRLCGGRQMLETLEPRATHIHVVAQAPLPNTPHFSHAQEVCRKCAPLAARPHTSPPHTSPPRPLQLATHSACTAAAFTYTPEDY